MAIASASVIPVFLAGALAVQIEHSTGMHADGIGESVAIYFACGALTSVWIGHVAERLGFARVLRISTVVSALALFLIGGLGRSLPAIAGLLALAGLANGAAQPAINGYLAERANPASAGLAFGLKQSSVPIATLLGGLAVPAIALTVGWPWAFAGAGVLALVVGRLLPRDVPKTGTEQSQKLGRPDPYSGDPEPSRGGPEPISPSTGPGGTGPGATGLARSGVEVAPLIALALAGALGAGAANALGSFLVSAGVHDSFSPGVAGLLAAMGSVCGLTSRIVSGARADRRGGGHLRVVAIMLLVGAGGYLLLATGIQAAFIAGTVLAYGAGWGWNGLFNFAVVRTHPHAPARATGITQAGVFVGGILGPLAFGLLVAHASYAIAWGLDVAAAFAAAAAMLAGRRLMVRRQGMVALHQIDPDS